VAGRCMHAMKPKHYIHTPHPTPPLTPPPTIQQDAFGNYVVQYVLDIGQTGPSGAIMESLMGHYGELSMQKFSSNVVEKCLKLGGLEEVRNRVVRELTASPLLPRLLQDSYGNYVIQSALAVSSGDVHSGMVDAIRPHVGSLRGTPHGKRILQKMGSAGK